MPVGSVESVFVGLVVSARGVVDICGCDECIGIVGFGWNCGASGVQRGR